MTFVNEIISEQDKLNFDFNQIKRPPLYLDPIRPYQWTVDRGRSVSLIATGVGREDDPSVRYFSLVWKGEEIRLKLKHEAKGANAEHVTSTWTLVQIVMPTDLGNVRSEILEVLKEALTAYKVGGVVVQVASHEARFAF